MTEELTPTALIMALVALALQAVMGFLILVSGLIAPYPVVLALGALWVAATVYGVRIWRRRVGIAILVPISVFAVWLTTILVGAEVLGLWTA